MIHEFDPSIYPCRLYVGMNPTFEEISEKFYGLTNENERIDIGEIQCSMDNFVVAKTHAVSCREDGWIGVCVAINRKKAMTAKTIAHEACHCADFICENFGIVSRKFDDGEAYAYLVGWIADCIEKVVKGKIK